MLDFPFGSSFFREATERVEGVGVSILKKG